MISTSARRWAYQSRCLYDVARKGNLDMTSIRFSIGIFALMIVGGCQKDSPAPTASLHSGNAIAQTRVAASSGQSPASQPVLTYHVIRATAPISPDAKWDKPAWQSIAPIELTHFMGKKPDHFPHTKAKLAYDDRFLYVIFKVDDRYVRAVAPNHQGSVCHDSCVEFFFTPGTDITKGYFNLEMNCGGTMLFNYQLIPWKNPVLIKDTDLARVETAHTLPAKIDPEIVEPTTWTLEYRVPTDLLAAYCPSAQKPAPGVTWRANVYKCADLSSRPHWLTWSPVGHPTPNFHLPEYFGTLVFD